MKKHKNISILYVLIALFYLKGFSQQNVQYTHYMYNMSVINPAYTVDEIGKINLGTFYRTQWVGIENAPTSANLFGHVALSESIEVGASLVHDKIGKFLSSNRFSADFAYKINLNDIGLISFGIKGSVKLFNINLKNLSLDNTSDVSFLEDKSKTFFNVGAGVFFNTGKYYIGISAPLILEEKFISLNESNDINQSVNISHFYFTGGYVFSLNNGTKLKPSFLLKVVKGAPISLDTTLNVLLKERFELGLSYRYEDSVSALTSYAVKPNLKIGYSYDYTLSKLNDFSNGSHEIFILFSFSKGGSNKFDRSPRFY